MDIENDDHFVRYRVILEGMEKSEGRVAAKMAGRRGSPDWEAAWRAEKGGTFCCRRGEYVQREGQVLAPGEERQEEKEVIAWWCPARTGGPSRPGRHPPAPGTSWSRWRRPGSGCGTARSRMQSG